LERCPGPRAPRRQAPRTCAANWPCIVCSCHRCSTCAYRTAGLSRRSAIQCCEETTPRRGLYRTCCSGGHEGHFPQVGTGTGHLHEALCVCVTAWCTYVLEPSSAFSGDTREQEEPCARWAGQPPNGGRPVASGGS